MLKPGPKNNAAATTAGVVEAAMRRAIERDYFGASAGGASAAGASIFSIIGFFIIFL